MRSARAAAWRAAFLAAAVSACADRLPTGPGSPGFLISDGAHSGNAHFFFLPPLVPAPRTTGTAEGGLSPMVTVCEWSGTACVKTIAQFSMSTGTGSEIIRYDATGAQYIVNWHTDRCVEGACTLDPTKTYRLRTMVGAVELGFADVDVVSNGSQLKNVLTNEYIGLVNGRTLPVKFRIERGAVSVLAAGGSAPVGASGGNVTTADGSVGLAIPSGALGGTTDISAATVEPPAEGTGPWAPVIELGPEGTTFAQPVTLTLAYTPQNLPAGVPDSALGVYTFDGTGWEAVPGSVVNQIDHTVSAPISHFSYYVVNIRPNTLSSGGTAPTTLTVGQTTQLSVYAFYTYPCGINRNCQNPLVNYSVFWIESNAAATIPSGPSHTDGRGEAVSPVITARAPGTAFAAARIFGTYPACFVCYIQSNTVVLTVIPSLKLFVDARVDPGLAPRQVGIGQEFVLTPVLPNVAGTNLALAVSHSNAAVAAITTAASIAQGQNFVDLNVLGRSAGRDTIVVAAPGYGPDTVIVDVGLGQIQVAHFPATLRIDDSVAISIESRNPSNTQTDNAFGMTFTLGGTPNLRFSDGHQVITSIAIPDGARATGTFYVTAIGPGIADVTITNPNYRDFAGHFSIDSPPLVFSVFGVGTNPFVKFGFRQGTGMFSIIPAPLATPLTVSFTHSNVLVANSTDPTATIRAGLVSEAATLIAGTVAGRDTVIGTAPGYGPDTLVIETGPGRIFVVDWPAALAYGDSAAIRIRPENQDSTLICNAWATSFALSSNATLSFSRNSVPITSIAVPDGSSSTPVFYVKAIAAGAAIMTVTNTWYITGPYLVDIAAPPHLSLLPGTRIIPAWIGSGELITIPTALAADLSVSVTNRNGFLLLYESGTANNVYGGQTGTFVVRTGTTAKSMNMWGTLGIDTIIVAAAGFSPDTAIVTVVPATLRVSGWPSTLATGDSAAIQVTAADQNGVPAGLGYAVTFALSASGGLVFSNGQAAITSIEIQQNSATFYVKAVAAGQGSMTISHRDFVTYTNNLTVPPPPQPPAPLAPGPQVISGGKSTCELPLTGPVFCWGETSYGATAATSSAFSTVGGGGFQYCGIKTDQQLECWGHNGDNRATPPGGSFRQISVSAEDACALRTDDTAACWGFTGDGRASVPAGTYTQITVGWYHGCAIRPDATLVCWGRAQSGAEIHPPANERFREIAANAFATCGIRTDYTLSCFGSSPTPPSGYFIALGPSVGGHMCAIAFDRSLACWGQNDFGQASPPAGQFIQVSEGGWHSCGVKTDHSVVCWGSGATGATTVGQPAGWTTGTTMPTARPGTGGIIGGMLYVAGGNFCCDATGTPQITDRLEAYDLQANSWSTRTPMPTARLTAASAVIGGKLYVVGGVDVVDSHNHVLDALEAYDPTTDSWAMLAPLPRARNYLAAAAVNGKLYVFGGTTTDAQQSAVADVDIYDPATNTWTSGAPMLAPRYTMGAATLNGIIYLVGGYDRADGYQGRLRTVEAYDPVTDSWSTKASSPTSRGQAPGLSVLNGLLYAAGGFCFNCGNALTTLEEYNPATNTWTTRLPMSWGRWGPVTASYNGALYVVGGSPNSGTALYGVVEIYHP
jgi:N-acetylneuraminic acid mutarotase